MGVPWQIKASLAPVLSLSLFAQFCETTYTWRSALWRRPKVTPEARELVSFDRMVLTGLY